MRTINEQETDAILKLAEENERLKTIIRHAVADRTGVYFICGEAGEKDANGLPEKIMVCPAMGADGFAVYERKVQYTAPAY